MPIELEGLLLTQPNTMGFQPKWAIPEYETKLDALKGKGRNHDLIVMGTANAKKTLISIESKVDESFDDIVSEYQLNSVREILFRKSPRVLIISRRRCSVRRMLGLYVLNSFMP